MCGRDPLLTSLASMWEAVDPMPEDLVERLLAAMALDDLDMEYELLHLVSRSDRLAGVRGTPDVLTLSFEGSDITMVLRVSRTAAPDACRIDGWITPSRRLVVTASQGAHSVETAVDDGGGRFELAGLRCGPTRFVVTPDDGAKGTTLATPPVDL